MNKEGMASHKQVLEFSSSLLFRVCFLLLFFFICQSHHHHHRAAATAINSDGFDRRSWASDSAADKVTLSLYYESLCPYCANFIVNELVKVFETDLVSVVNLRLIPWGNTQITINNSWICQHGRDECLLDMVEACVINVWPQTEIHFKFIRCVEDLRLKNMHNQWQSCFGSLGLSQTPIRDCFNTGLAVRLEQMYADETAHLNPPHRFVPWVLVNDIPLQEDFLNFVGYICRSYRGNNVPQACKSHAFEFNSLRAVNSSQVWKCRKC